MDVQKWEVLHTVLQVYAERVLQNEEEVNYEEGLVAAHKKEIKSLIPVVARNALACVDCFELVSEWEDQEYVMVKDELWREIAGPDHQDMLCATCMENRLGRRLRPDDLTDAPVNLRWKKQTKLNQAVCGNRTCK